MKYSTVQVKYKCTASMCRAKQEDFFSSWQFAVCSCSDAKRKYRKATLQVLLHCAALCVHCLSKHFYTPTPFSVWPASVAKNRCEMTEMTHGCNFLQFLLPSCDEGCESLCCWQREYTLRYYSCRAYAVKLKLGHCVDNFIAVTKSPRKDCKENSQNIHIAMP